MTDDNLAVPGMVVDAEDLDAKLITVKMRATPHFTGGDIDLIERHFAKELSELTMGEQTTAFAYIYLRRAGLGPTWETAADGVTIVHEEAPMDPTDGPTSETSPSSADTGDAPPATSTP